MKMISGIGRVSGLSRLAASRLLNAGPETCDRIEASVLVAIKKADCTDANLGDSFTCV